MDDNQIVETLKSSFLESIRTGNVYIDTIMGIVLVCLTTYLVSLARNLQYVHFVHFKELLLKWFGPKKQQEKKIIVSGKKIQGTNRTRVEYSTTFCAVIHQIKKLDCDQANITELSEIDMKDYAEEHEEKMMRLIDSRRSKKDDDDEEKKEADSEANLMVTQSKPFMLVDDVYFVVNIKKGSDGSKEGNKDGKSEEIQITIKSSVLSMNSLRKIVNGWIEEYQQSLAPDGNLRYFCYSAVEENPEDTYYEELLSGKSVKKNYIEFRFDSSKSFNNVFFPEKDDVVEMIDFFTNNKPWYKTRGIPYTLGFLLHGEPGCGKTSTIKAIANHTRRHIVSVPLDKIKNIKELLCLFSNAKINGKDIPMDSRLYVLEDIDAGDLKDIVADRAGLARMFIPDSDKIVEVETDDELTILKLSEIPNVKVVDPKKNRLTLAALLEVLDGVMEMDGRMLVITTNYPERLDKALIRPGRIDIKLKFGRCTRDCLASMYQHFFQTTLPKAFDKESLPDKKWTPAEIIGVFIYHMRDPQQALKYLIKSNPQEGLDMGALGLNRTRSKAQPTQRDEETEEKVADQIDPERDEETEEEAADQVPET